MATFDFSNLLSVAKSQIPRFGQPCFYDSVSSISGGIFEDRVENVVPKTGSALFLELELNRGRAEALKDFQVSDLVYMMVLLDQNERVEVEGILTVNAKKYKLVFVNTEAPDGQTVLYQEVYGKLQK